MLPQADREQCAAFIVSVLGSFFFGILFHQRLARRARNGNLVRIPRQNYPSLSRI